jgi:small-conductance mechanosensitive channel
MFDGYQEQLFSAPWWQYTFLGSAFETWALAVIVLVLLLAVFKIFELLILSRLAKLSERTSTDVDDALVTIVRSIRPRFYVIIAFWAALHVLSLGLLAKSIIDVLVIIGVGLQAAHSLQVLVDFMTKKRVEDPTRRSALQIIGKIAKVVVWIFAVLLVLSNIGVDVTSLIAGLGIGGIAIALALQGILSDLFSSFSLYFDKPFEIGDFIVVGDTSGVVQKIGIKTTRIRSSQGEEIVVSNQDLTTARVHNYKKMEERRAIVSFDVVYDTSQDNLEAIPDIVRGIVDAQDKTRFDRCHLKAFGDSALEFEATYYVASGEYACFLDINQAVHLGIKKAFDEKGIEMAFPTQTIHMMKG